jgi:hypothetical protein
MAIAEIESLRNGADPKTGESRDDLVIGDIVTVVSVNAGTAYQWSIAFKPEGSAAVFSSTGTEQAILQNPGTFTVDVDGPYLIRLVLTDGTGTTEQFVRLRALTVFGDLRLVAAGERYDTLKVPVDATFDGWADEQNFNLNTLLGLVKATTSQGNVVYVDAAGGGDYTAVQSAIDFAVSQAPTALQPWVVLVRPGTYTEDLTFAPYVHVFGWPGGRETQIVTVRNATVAGHTIALPGAGESLALADIYFQQPVTSPNAAFDQTGAGTVRVFRCTLEAQGNTGEVWFTQGPTYLTECVVNGNGVNPTDYALRSTSLLILNHTFVNGMSCVRAEGGIFFAKDTRFVPTGTYAINTNASNTHLQWCQADGLIAANPSGVGAPGDLRFQCMWSAVKDITIDGNAVVGTAQVELGSATHDSVTPINGATVDARVPSDTNFYDNTVTGLTAANVQAALDEIHAYAAAVRTLDDAYDGGLPGSGSGRSITADAGAVQIVDAPAPSDPIPPGNTNGNLDVVGAVKLGALTKPEINLDPNPFDNGPVIRLGHETWANDAPYGGNAWVMGNATGLPQDHNYNLILGTMPAEQGTNAGRVVLMGGNSLSDVDAGSVYIQGGTGQGLVKGLAGDIYLVPGESAAGVPGQVLLVDQSTGTGATLTAAGAFVNPMQAGEVTFGTNSGPMVVAFAGGENLAAVHALFDATGVVTAAGDPIVLTTVAKGPTAEIYFLAESGPGLDATLGGFNGETMAPGTWPTATPLTGGSSGWPTGTGTDLFGLDYEMAELNVANAYIVLKPGNAGAIQTSVNDATPAGGSNRGSYATDWQRFRTASTAVASGQYATISGGRQNQASGQDSAVSGGQANRAASACVVGGGFENFADDEANVIAGGYQNQTFQPYSAVVGGRENRAKGEGAVAMGIRSNTILSGQVVHASGSFTGTGDGSAQHGRMVLRTTTNNSIVEMNTNAGFVALSANDYFTLGNNTGHTFTLHVIARSTAVGETAWWSVEGCIIRDANAASTILIPPAPPSLPTGDSGGSAANFRLNVSANNVDGRLTIEAESTGYVGDVRWVATLQTTQVAI